MNNNLVINNKEYMPSEICTINTPMNKQAYQRKLGMGVIANTVKALKFAVTSDRFTCVIYYGYPKTLFIENILNEAVYNGKDVYYRVRDINYEYTPTEAEKTARDKYLERKAYKEQAHTARMSQIEEMYDGMRIPEDRKLKMRRYISYYDLDYPQSEPEWVEMFYQLAYYIKNKIGYEAPEYTPEEQALIDSYQMDKEITYGFDNNQYYICEECGELVNRGNEELHCCYCDIPAPRTKIDYIVNGDE